MADLINPKLELEKVSFKVKAFPPSAIVTFDVGLKNDNSFDINLLKGNISVEIEDIEFSTEFEKQVVKAGGKLTLPLETKLPVTIINKVKNIKGTHNYEIACQININTPAGDIPIKANHNGSITI